MTNEEREAALRKLDAQLERGIITRREYEAGLARIIDEED